ncbi:MAG: hypothetical protein N3A66_12395, partial [Planctomycetota bacterium]|nr:hypothetical protein [Planctomycetota bacterium]
MALFAVAAALVYLAYPPRVRTGVGRRCWAPLLCRSAASVVLFLLLVRPEIDIITRRPEAKTLLLLLDRSASMGIKESDGISRLRRAALAARDSERLLAGAPALQPRIIPFAAAPGAPLSGEDLLTATAAGDETDIGLALQAAAAIRPPVCRVVLLSDGNDTTGLDPVAAAMALAVPVDVVPVGEERAEAGERDVWLSEVDRRDNAPIGSVLPITAQVDAVGYA